MMSYNNNNKINICYEMANWKWSLYTVNNNNIIIIKWVCVCGNWRTIEEQLSLMKKITVTV